MPQKMETTNETGEPTPLDMTSERFRELGHALVDRIAEFYATMGETTPIRSRSTGP